MSDETDNKKQQYIKREEVRTMEKDIARLRESEAETAREKIAELKTGEEAAKEARRLEQLKAAAEEREGLEIKEKEKQKELERLKLEREQRAASTEALSVEEEERQKETIRSQLKEAQLREEEERRRFLENVSAKAEGRAVEEKLYTPPAPSVPTPDVGITPPIETPPPPPITEQPTSPSPPIKKPFKFPRVQLPKVPVPKVEGYFPAKSSLFAKIWVRVIVSLLVLAILAAIGTFWYWYLAIKEKPTLPPAPITPTTPATTPEIAKKQPEIVQRLLGVGYYLPSAPRIIDAIILHSGNSENGDPYDIENVIALYETAKVATHYLISRDGRIYQLAPDNTIAYHAGAGHMPDGRGNVNNFSIGISLVYKENEAPNDAQYESLAWLINKLRKEYGITEENILGYKDIAPVKTTPWNFDWDKLKKDITLSLEEKIGQMLIIGFEGTKLTQDVKNLIKTTRPGGVILFKKNIENPKQIKELINDLQEVSLSVIGLPLLVAIDQEGGVVSRIDFAKEKTGQSEIKTADQAYGVGLERGKELKELGINLNLSPVLDLTQPDDFLHNRSFQKDSEEIGILGQALISGQKKAGILTAIKHFPGYGSISFNPEEKLATLTNMPQVNNFRRAMAANPELIMLASVIYSSIDPNLPITLSPKGVSFLKKEVGDVPLVITDDLSQLSLLGNFSLKGAAMFSVEAGADLLLFSDYLSGASAASLLKEAVEEGDISEEIINKAALRIIQLKNKVGE